MTWAEMHRLELTKAPQTLLQESLHPLYDELAEYIE